MRFAAKATSDTGTTLVRQLSLSPDGMDIATHSIATIRDHFQNEQLRKTPTGEKELRNAFAELATRHPESEDIETLRKALSVAVKECRTPFLGRRKLRFCSNDGLKRPSYE